MRAELLKELKRLNDLWHQEFREIWVKSGSDKGRVTAREEIQRMFQSANLVHSDSVIVEGSTAGDIDLDHFSEFFERNFGESLDKGLEKEGISLGQLLNNLGLAQDVTLKLAGLLIFGRQD